MKKLFLLLIGLILALPIHAAGVAEAVSKNGFLKFTDGSSIYAFYEDGSFDLTPCGMSGRTIKGKWKEVDGAVVVEGEWSWANGLSEPNDKRIMRLHVNVYPAEDQETAGMNDVPATKVYFTIESIRKVKPNQSEVSIQLRAPRFTS